MFLLTCFGYLISFFTTSKFFLNFFHFCNQFVAVNFTCFGSLVPSLALTKFPSATGMPCYSTVKPCSLTLKILKLSYSKVFFHHSVDLC